MRCKQESMHVYQSDMAVWRVSFFLFKCYVKEKIQLRLEYIYIEEGHIKMNTKKTCDKHKLMQPIDGVEIHLTQLLYYRD